MRKVFLGAGLAAAILGLLSCASPEGKTPMKFYHGANVPREFFSLVHASEDLVEIEARVDFRESHLYHMILDGDEIVAGSWLPTSKIRGGSYTIKLAPNKGMVFRTGKTYRLCIGAQNPEATARYSDNYKCAADYEFTLPAAWF